MKFALLKDFHLISPKYCVGCPEFNWKTTGDTTSGSCASYGLIQVDNNLCPVRSPLCQAAQVEGTVGSARDLLEVHRTLVEALAFYATGCHIAGGTEASPDKYIVDEGGHARETLLNIGFTEAQIGQIMSEVEASQAAIEALDA